VQPSSENDKMALLEQLQADASLQREMEFEEKLKALMADYGVDLAKVVAILRSAAGRAGVACGGCREAPPPSLGEGLHLQVPGRSSI